MCIAGRCARSPFALCICERRVLYFGVGTYERVKLLAACSLPTTRRLSSRHCMLRAFATRGLVATGGGMMFPRREHGRSPCTGHVKRLCSLTRQGETVSLIRAVPLFALWKWISRRSRYNDEDPDRNSSPSGIRFHRGCPTRVINDGETRATCEERLGIYPAAL